MAKRGARAISLLLQQAGTAEEGDIRALGEDREGMGQGDRGHSEGRAEGGTVYQSFQSTVRRQELRGQLPVRPSTPNF